MPKSNSNRWGEDAVLAGECIKLGALEFAQRFAMTPAQMQKYRPLFLALVSSTSGELAVSTGIFERSGVLWEVSGTECSVWDFNGQFDPEPVNTAALRHRLIHGRLGISDVDNKTDLYRQALLDAIDHGPLKDFEGSPIPMEGRIALGRLIDTPLPSGETVHLSKEDVAQLTATFSDRAIPIEYIENGELLLQSDTGSVFRFDRSEAEYFVFSGSGRLHMVAFDGSISAADFSYQEHDQYRAMSYGAAALWDEIRVSLDLGVDMVENHIIGDPEQPASRAAGGPAMGL